jgi:hypothetical protein
VRRRRIGFSLIIGALVPLAVAATAWGCGLLAALRTDASVANPGQALNVTGVNYTNSAAFTPVQIRWNSRTGPILDTAIADASGRINKQITVPPNANPGWYVLNATQYNTTTGQPRQGTPGRTTVRVQGAATGAAATWGSTPGGGTPVKVGDPGSPALAPTLLAVVLSLGLLAGGVTLVSRGRSRRALGA